VSVTAAGVSEGSALEREILEHARAERWADAATVAILGYGPELLGFLRAASSSNAEAEDVFAELSERLWRKLPEFGWRSTFRSWAYVIARRLLVDRRRQVEARQRREVPWSDVPPPQIAAAIRSTLASTPQRDEARLALVRSLLDDDERALLVLRIERRMRWPEIVRILADVDDDAERIDREAARLRKQFARITARLRKGIAEREE
jgi:RNA polymerase sigma-70 factor (ECF subfamily)